MDRVTVGFDADDCLKIAGALHAFNTLLQAVRHKVDIPTDAIVTMAKLGCEATQMMVGKAEEGCLLSGESRAH